MSKLQDQNVHASNSMIIRIRGREVGRAQGVDFSVDHGLEAVMEGIGSTLPAEHVSLAERSEGTVDSFFIRRRTVAGKSGVKDVLGVPINESILLTEPFQLLVMDKLTGEMLLAADECTWASESISIRQGAITGKNARFMCIRFRQAADYEPPVATS